MSEGHVQLPIELLRKLTPLAESMGISLPGMGLVAPELCVDAPAHHLALELGRITSNRNLFLRGQDLMTVDPKTGDLTLMRPARFITWISEHIRLFSRLRGAEKECSLSREVATIIMESDRFRAAVRKIDAVHTVRLPVFRADGTVELLQPGYDAASRTYTVEAVKYELDWTMERARNYLDFVLQSYPWSEQLEPQRCRSAAVQVAAIVGTFCRAMFPPGTTRPMIAYLANQPGTGKSTLAAMALAPVFGLIAANKTPKDDEIMDKELETVAQTMQPYLFFDDIGGGIFSNPLNRFITSRAHTGRVMGSNKEMFRAAAVTQVYATGNGIKLSPDLMRRALVVDLFLATDVRDRQFEKMITPDWLAEDETRAQFLAACWAFVKHWHEVEEGNLHAKPLESFESWSGVVGAIVVSAGFADPLRQPELPVGGDQEGSEFRELFVRLATEAAGRDTTFTRSQLITKARAFGLLEELVGMSGDKDLDSRANIRLGRRLEKWRGRVLLDGYGRQFAFDHRRQTRGATYPLNFVTIAPKAPIPLCRKQP